MRKRQYHHARRTRQLKHLIKKVMRLSNTKHSRDLAANYIQSLKDILQEGISITWGIRRKLLTLSGLSLLALTPLQAQFQLTPIEDRSFNLWDGVNQDSIVVLDQYFIDTDLDGDMDAFYSGFPNLLTFGQFSFRTYFQENTSTENLIRFDEPQELDYADTSTLPIISDWIPTAADLDGDGDYDLYYTSTENTNPPTFFLKISENTSSDPNSFSFLEPDSIRILEYRVDNVDNVDIFSRPQFSDLDQDGDKDLFIPISGYESYEYYSSHFLYYENNGSEGLFPFDTSARVNPFSLDNVTDNMVLEDQTNKPLITLFIDVDKDGDDDLITASYVSEYDSQSYNYYGTFKVFYFENEGGDTASFSPQRNDIVEYPRIGTVEDTMIWAYPGFTDIDGDGDLDALPRLIFNENPTFNNWDFRSLSFFQENLAGEANLISGKVFLDSNQDDNYNAGDFPLAGREIFLNEGEYILQSDDGGDFVFYLRNGNHILSTNPPAAWQSTPEIHNFNLSGSPDTLEANFAWTPDAIERDLRIDGIGVTATRFGFNASYRIKLTNEGTTVESGTIYAYFDDGLIYENASPEPDQINGSNLEWEFSDLLPLESRWTEVNMNISTTLNSIGDTMCSDFIVDPYDGDLSRYNNSDTLCQIITGAVDPNDKLVQPLGTTPEGIVSPDTDLFSYTIRFQNTGTDTAFRVIIIDQLDEHFDLSTFEMVASSHPYDMEVDSNRVATWTLDNILLPDSNVNVEGSNGFLQYDIRPLANQPIGTQFTNEADIYFDFNDPVRTNRTLNTFDITLGLGIDQILEFKLYPNPSAEKAILTFENNTRSKAILEVYDLTGKLVLLDEQYGEAFDIDRTSLPGGTYTFRLSVNGLKGAGKLLFVD
ncbi:MAG: T9SS type A sorting domain-containing protein [Bacteroidetes bacterium]|nr:T9SS type A sorting domain-containing protein [Bacteroidota bacterium]